MPHTLQDGDRQLAATFMTTEHFTLQSARSLATSESSGRAALYLSTLSSALVALGFAAQASEFGDEFHVFALLILPPITFLGLITFQRTVQSGIEDEMYARGINRIRHLYVDLVPQMRPYFVLGLSDEGQHGHRQGSRRSAWHMFLTIASVVGVINSVVLGSAAGLGLNLITDPPLPLALGSGIAATLVGVFAHYRYQHRQWTTADAGYQALFPAVIDAPPA